MFLRMRFDVLSSLRKGPMLRVEIWACKEGRGPDHGVRREKVLSTKPASERNARKDPLHQKAAELQVPKGGRYRPEGPIAPEERGEEGKGRVQSDMPGSATDQETCAKSLPRRRTHPACAF